LLQEPTRGVSSALSRLYPSCSSTECSAHARKDSSAHFPMGEPRRLAFILFYSFRSFDRGHSDIIFAARAFTLDQTLARLPVSIRSAMDSGSSRYGRNVEPPRGSHSSHGRALWSDAIV